jgi:hypothetical protein
VSAASFGCLRGSRASLRARKTSPQGISAGGFGLSIRTEDIARFGQLYLQRGKWQRKQLIPEAWIEAATARQTSNSAYTQGSSVPAVCLPSRTMIQTGQSYLHVRRDAPTLAQTVRRAGFASIRSGKFGNNPNRLDADFDQHLDGVNAQGSADNVIRFIRAQGGKKPMFVYMASNEPHDPQFALAEYYAMYRPANIPLPCNFLPFHPFDNGEMTVRDEMTLPWPPRSAAGSPPLRTRRGTARPSRRQPFATPEGRQERSCPGPSCRQ